MAQQVGKYQLIEKLAEGGMAEVFLAKVAGPSGFEKTLVLKLIRRQLLENARVVEMFLAEARRVARLNHSNIVQVYELGEVDGTHFMAMEYVDGPNLRRLASRARASGSPMPYPLVAKIISMACEGLAYAHDLKEVATGRPLRLVHRDISPDNILLSRTGGVKVADFGIAKAADAGPHTRTGVVKGKLQYMSPEQVRARPLDLRADVFSVGIVLYELLAGVRPFDAEGPGNVMRAIVEEPPTPLHELRADMPKDLERVVERALEKRPEDRYQSCGDLQADLDRYVMAAGELVRSHEIADAVERYCPPGSEKVLNDAPRFTQPLPEDVGSKGGKLREALMPTRSGIGEDPRTVPDDGLGPRDDSWVPVGATAIAPPPRDEPTRRVDDPHGTATVEPPRDALTRRVDDPMGATAIAEPPRDALARRDDIARAPTAIAEPPRDALARRDDARAPTAIAEPPRYALARRSDDALARRSDDALARRSDDALARRSDDPQARRTDPTRLAHLRQPRPEWSLSRWALPIGAGLVVMLITFAVATSVTGDPDPSALSEPHLPLRAAKPVPPAPPVAPPVAQATALQPSPPASPAPPPEEPSVAPAEPVAVAKPREPQAAASEPAFATLVVESEPPGLVRVNGRAIGRTPARLANLPPGPAKVEVFDPVQHFSRTETWSLAAGKITSRKMVVQRSRVQFRIQPFATVFMDGRLVGQTPVDEIEAWEGAHRVRLINEELRKDLTVDFPVRAGQPNVFKYILDE